MQDQRISAVELPIYVPHPELKLLVIDIMLKVSEQSLLSELYEDTWVWELIEYVNRHVHITQSRTWSSFFLPAKKER